MVADTGAFAGFSPRATAFYAALEADNSREFWAAHKAGYEVEVREPMRALLDALEPEFGSGKLFRPHRDIRFSHDKSPYKTHQGAFVGRDLGVGYYVQLDAEGLRVGGGFRSHGSAQVNRYRRAVDSAAGETLATMVGALRSGGFTVEGDPVKTTPRGWSADHPRIDLLRCRSLMVFRDHGRPRWLATAAALDRIRADWRAVRPLAAWAEEHVGGAGEIGRNA